MLAVDFLEQPLRTDLNISTSGVGSDVTHFASALFQQPWWLQAVAPGSWDAVVAVEDNEVVGRLPFVHKRRLGLTILSQPPLTPYLGPWVKAGTGKAHARLQREHRIFRSLIAALPEHDVYTQNFHYSVTNVLPFYWQGFSPSISYTYVIDDLDDPGKIWAGFRENIRREIRKAERRVVVRDLDDVETFIALNRKTFDRQSMQLPYSPELIRRLDAACSARGVRRIFLAESADGTPHAALYLVWDSESAYYLMSGSDPHLRTSGAMSLLMWEAIKHAGQVTRRFDFCGSTIQPVERFFRAFGARQVRYMHVSRGRSLRGHAALLSQHLRTARWRPRGTRPMRRGLPGSRTMMQPAMIDSSRRPDAGPRANLPADGVTPYAHSLFEQPWWLDAVAPGAWDAVTVAKGGEIVGRLPYVRMRRFGLTILGQPPLNQFLGPWIKPGTGKPHTRLEREYEIMRGLIAALPRHDVFIQNFHYSITSCLPFYWQGYSHSVRYTYVLEDLDDLDKIWAGLRKTVRVHIRGAEQEVVVREVDDVEPFIALNRMTYERQGMTMPYSPDLVRRLDAACRARGVRRILLAEGADGTPHAAVYLVWDAESAYSLMSGNDPRLRHSGAISLLRWEAIKFARQVTRRFDFEGSMLQSVERFFRAFGAQQVQFPRLTRGATLRGQLALMSYEWSRARKRCSRAS
jgi:lipid II:glycine glycyltransferase (peptidoglycan interpeptide bridge formation enzyme)